MFFSNKNNAFAKKAQVGEPVVIALPGFNMVISFPLVFDIVASFMVITVV